ncbi:MAG: hypothetical protein IJ599_05055 [Alphaproteobacteria bacterium]|nr:hypothetical protein [Alphaproteobacteria bacterium]
MNDLNERVELYKLYVNSAEQISSARMKANAFFLTLNAAPFVNFFKIDKTLALILGVLINICWFLLLQSYKKLNSAKFKVIQEVERNLPYQCFTAEERYYKQDKRKDFSAIEKCVPIVIIICYLIVFLEGLNLYGIGGHKHCRYYSDYGRTW